MARNPAGPWFDPIGCGKSMESIVAVLDTDGKTYILTTDRLQGDPSKKATGDWIQEFDLAARKLIGPRKVLINGASIFPKSRCGSRDRECIATTVGTSHVRGRWHQRAAL